MFYSFIYCYRYMFFAICWSSVEPWTESEYEEKFFSFVLGWLSYINISFLLFINVFQRCFVVHAFLMFLCPTLNLKPYNQLQVCHLISKLFRPFNLLMCQDLNVVYTWSMNIFFSFWSGIRRCKWGNKMLARILTWMKWKKSFE